MTPSAQTETLPATPVRRRNAMTSTAVTAALAAIQCEVAAKHSNARVAVFLAEGERSDGDVLPVDLEHGHLRVA